MLPHDVLAGAEADEMPQAIVGLRTVSGRAFSPRSPKVPRDCCRMYRVSTPMTCGSSATCLFSRCLSAWHLLASQLRGTSRRRRPLPRRAAARTRPPLRADGVGPAPGERHDVPRCKDGPYEERSAGIALRAHGRRQRVRSSRRNDLPCSHPATRRPFSCQWHMCRPCASADENMSLVMGTYNRL